MQSLIRQCAGNFDLSTVFILNLDSLGWLLACLDCVPFPFCNSISDSLVSPDLRTIDPCINECVHLQSLDLSHNCLDSLAGLDGAKLQHLKQLNLSDNRITSLGMPASLHHPRITRLTYNEMWL
jgi:hypothetical protein